MHPAIISNLFFAKNELNHKNSILEKNKILTTSKNGRVWTFGKAIEGRNGKKWPILKMKLKVLKRKEKLILSYSVNYRWPLQLS